MEMMMKRVSVTTIYDFTDEEYDKYLTLDLPVFLTIKEIRQFIADGKLTRTSHEGKSTATTIHELLPSSDN